jgi:hypothetical protein
MLIQYSSKGYLYYLSSINLYLGSLYNLSSINLYFVIYIMHMDLIRLLYISSFNLYFVIYIMHMDLIRLLYISSFDLIRFLCQLIFYSLQRTFHKNLTIDQTFYHFKFKIVKKFDALGKRKDCLH